MAKDATETSTAKQDGKTPGFVALRGLSQIGSKGHIMGRLASVKFRGEEHDVEIDQDTGYEYDTGSHEIEWHFYGLTPEQHNALNITDDEEQSIFEQLAAISAEGDDFYDPAEWR